MNALTQTSISTEQYNFSFKKFYHILFTGDCKKNKSWHRQEAISPRVNNTKERPWITACILKMLSIEYNDEKGPVRVCVFVVLCIIYKREMGTQWLTIFPKENNNNNNNNNEHNNKHNSTSICKRALWDVIYLCRNDEWQCCTLWWIIHNFSWDDNCLVNESQFEARRRENNARIFIFSIIVIWDVDLCSASDDNRVFIYTVPAVSSLAVDRRSVLSTTRILILLLPAWNSGELRWAFISSSQSHGHLKSKQEPSLQLINSSMSTTTFINLARMKGEEDERGKESLN